MRYFRRAVLPGLATASTLVVSATIGAAQSDPMREALIARNEPEALRLLEVDPALAKRRDPGNGTYLHLAAQFGHAEVARRLLALKVPVDPITYNDFSPLHIAATCGSEEVVALLIEAGAQLDRVSAPGTTALNHAAQHSHPEIVRLLLDAGASYDLRTACTMGDLDQVSALITRDPARAKEPMMLRLAAQYGHPEVVEALLDDARALQLIAADPAAAIDAETDESAVLAWCARYDRFAVAEALVNAGIDIDAVSGVNMRTALHHCGYWGSTSITRLLLEKGATVDPRARTGYTPLHEAARLGNAEVVVLLLEAGADVRARDDRGQSPLDSVAEWGDHEATRVLLREALSR